MSPKVHTNYYRAFQSSSWRSETCCIC